MVGKVRGGGFNVLNDELGAHASKIDGIQERMQAAVDAAQQVSMNNDAYGVICQPFAMLVQPFEELGINALKKAAESVSEQAGKVRDSVKMYEAQEQATNDGVKALGAPLDA